MKTGYSIHQIELKTGSVTPGTVCEFDDKQFDELESLGAVREATEDEIALKALGEPKAAEPSDVNPLHAQADALDIKYNKNISDEKLQERIAEAEKAKADAEETANAGAGTDPDTMNL